MDAKGRRVCDENIQGASVADAVPEQPWEQVKGSPIRFVLRVLIGAIGAIADAPAQTADQKLFKRNQLQIQVRAAFCVGMRNVDIVNGVMIPGHVQKRDVQQGDQIFEIGIRQIAASYDQLNIAEMPAAAETVQALHNFVADCKDFHRQIVPQNGFPGKG